MRPVDQCTTVQHVASPALIRTCMAHQRSSLKPVSVRFGLRTRSAHATAQTIDDTKPVKAVALLGTDYPGMRPRLRVEVGDAVHEGTCLFVDRRDEQVCFTAPVAGTIASIDFGPRRTLSALVIRASEAEEPEGQETASEPPAGNTPEAVRKALLESGLWPALRSRPFGVIPASDAVPSAIFVTAIDLNPSAVDPDPVVAAHEAHFQRGLEALAILAGQPVYVCLRTASTIRVGETQAIKVARFDGSYQAGLASTHIHRLAPASLEKPVWTIGYQDVIAIGSLFEAGRSDTRRIVALAGDAVERPHLLRVPLGARLNDLTAGELTPPKGKHNGARLLSGSPLTGRDSGFLSRYDTQVSAIAVTGNATRPAWVKRLAFLSSSSVHPLIPNTAMDRALPANVLAVPLMRALSVGDAQAAKRLGAMDLIEEDVAPLNCMCTSGADYRVLLRGVLTELAEDAA